MAATDWTVSIAVLIEVNEANTIKIIVSEEQEDTLAIFTILDCSDFIVLTSLLTLL
jgi:hypothetical protein